MTDNRILLLNHPLVLSCLVLSDDAVEQTKMY